MLSARVNYTNNAHRSIILLFRNERQNEHYLSQLTRPNVPTTEHTAFWHTKAAGSRLQSLWAQPALFRVLGYHAEDAITAHHTVFKVA